jgi:hypothetical protein
MRKSPSSLKMTFLLLAFLASGCFENNIGKFNNTASSTTLSSNNNSLSGFSISNVTVTSPSTASAGTDLTTSIFFNTATSTSSITNYCASASGSSSQACLCNFAWQQQLSTDGSVAPIQRIVQSNLITVQPDLVTCNAPQVYSTQIPTGTVIAVSVVPGTGNANSFGMTAFNFTKSSSTTGGSFTDNQGNSFQNIYRYSCYEEYQRGMSIGSQKVPLTNPTTGLCSNRKLVHDFFQLRRATRQSRFHRASQLLQSLHPRKRSGRHQSRKQYLQVSADQGSASQ